MRKVILNLAVSLDGYIEDANGGYEWCLADQDYGMTDFFSKVDTIFIGRKSYGLIAGSEDEAFPSIKQIYIFSDTLSSVEHPKVTIVSSRDFDAVIKPLLHTDGPDIWLYGGASLVSSFIEKRLINEFLLSVHPVILGGGKPLFQDVKEKVDLVLIDIQTYSTGLVQLRYTPKPVL